LKTTALRAIDKSDFQNRINQGHRTCGFTGSDALVLVLEPRWQSFSGLCRGYSSRRHLPSPLRAMVDFIREH
jgi:hypothetical protein